MLCRRPATFAGGLLAALSLLATSSLLATAPALAAPGIALPLRLLFAVVDTNGDGAVTKAEAHLLSDRIFAQIDASHRGAFTEADVTALRTRLGGDPRDAAEAHKVFIQMDANRDGKITTREWTARVDVEFARLDANRDGAITLEDLEGRDLDVPAGAASVLMP